MTFREGGDIGTPSDRDPPGSGQAAPPGRRGKQRKAPGRGRVSPKSAKARTGSTIRAVGTRSTRISEPQVSPLESSIGMLAKEVAGLRQAIEGLSARIADMDCSAHRGNPLADVRKPRVSDDTAKQAIKAYFNQRHGETLFPSDVADHLQIDYDTTVRLIGELERDGRVARV